MKVSYLITIIIIVLFFNSCEKDTEFKYDLNFLYNTNWGIPFVEAEGMFDPLYMNIAPTVFKEDGIVEFGQQYQEFWRIYDSQSIIIETISEIWQIFELSENKLHVNKLKHPTGEFLVECIYYPMD